MKNNHTWGVTILSGSECISHSDLTEEAAKEIFSKLAADTTRDINNDYIYMMVMHYTYKKVPVSPVMMQRVGKGEYIYKFGKKSTRDWHEAYQLIQRL